MDTSIQKPFVKNPFAKKPLLNLVKIKEDYIEPKEEFITMTEVAPIDTEKRLLAIGLFYILKKKELEQDEQSKILQDKIVSYVHDVVSLKHTNLIAYEFNKAIKDIVRNTEVNYECWNHSTTGLILVKYYIENNLTVNEKALLRLLNKQLMYIENGMCSEVYHDSVLLAENLRRHYYNEFEVSKTKEELMEVRRKFLKRLTKTYFTYFDKKTIVHKGSKLELDECVKQYGDTKLKKLFSESTNEYEFMTQNNIRIEWEHFE